MNPVTLGSQTLIANEFYLKRKERKEKRKKKKRKLLRKELGASK